MMQKTSPLDLSFSSRRISVTIEVAALANFANFLRQQYRLLYLSIISHWGQLACLPYRDNPRESIKWPTENLVGVMNLVIIVITLFLMSILVSYIIGVSFLKNYLCSFWSRVLKMVILGLLPDLSRFRYDL